MRKILLIALISFFIYSLHYSYASTWKSCCSSGCDFTPSCSPKLTINGVSYYCCQSGWSTSLCSECSGGGPSPPPPPTDNNPPNGDIWHTPLNPTDTDEVTYIATGSDGESGLSKIEIYIDSQLKKTCSLSPCEYKEGPYEAGSIHSYYAKIYDNAGNSFTTDTKSFSVSASDTCERSDPSLNIFPETQEGSPGATLTYTLYVSNNDNSACSSSTFTLEITSCPPSWACKINPQSLEISPGFTKTSTLSVTSASNAQTNTYVIGVLAKNSEYPSYSDSDVAYYKLTNPEPPAPTCGNGICEGPDESQLNCPSDCYTSLVVNPAKVYPGMYVRLILTFWDGNFNPSKDGKLNISIVDPVYGELEWNCYFHDKNWTEIWDRHHCSGNVCSGKHEGKKFSIIKGNYYGYLEFHCKIPQTLTAGTKTVKVTPVILGSKIVLKPAYTYIRITKPTLIEEIVSELLNWLKSFFYFF